MHWTHLLKETSRMLLEKREEISDNLEKVYESTKKACDETKSSNITRCKQDYMTEEDYTELREEIVKYYGISKVSAGEDKQYSKIQKSCESNRNEEILNITTSKEDHLTSEGDYAELHEDIVKYYGISTLSAVKDKECSKTQKPYEIDRNEECIKDESFKTGMGDDDYSILNEDENIKKITWHDKIVSKFISFTDLSLSYVSEPWSQTNPRNYLNKLSKILTG